MLKSIFGRQFAAYAVVLVVVFLLLGLVLSNLLEEYFFERQITQMTERGRETAQAYINLAYAEWRYHLHHPPGRPVPPLRFMSIRAQEDLERAWHDFALEVNVLYRRLGIGVIITDQHKHVRMATPDIYPMVQYGDTLEIDGLAAAFGGELVVVTGTMGGLLDENVLTVGYPILLQNGYVFGVIFMNVPLDEIEAMINDVVFIMAVCLLGGLAVSFVIAFFVSRGISKPIKQISAAAMEFSGGNFSKRISINSGGEVGSLAESFNYMAESLDNQERTRREFIANISHDLRSPLTSMRGFVTALIDGTAPPEAHRRYLNIVLDETDRLTNLTNNILEADIYREGAFSPNFSLFDINELLTETVLTFEAKCNEKGLSVDFRFERDVCVVNADEEAIRRVIVNLTDNAVKFSNNGGSIEISTFIRNSKLHVVVKDNGRGISLDGQKRVFERFYKADPSRGEDKHGSGLGLAIAREFIAAHGETITLHSSPGMGCEVVFTLSCSVDVARSGK